MFQMELLVIGTPKHMCACTRMVLHNLNIAWQIGRPNKNIFVNHGLKMLRWSYLNQAYLYNQITFILY
jgi:hypothetical protein